MNEENKMKVISYNSPTLNTQEQKISTLDGELLAIVYALQIYDFLIIGSPHPIYIFTDHKPLLHCFAKKGNLSPRFYRAQMQLTKFSKLKIIQTPGKHLPVADMLSRTFTKEQLPLHQLRHKQLPPQIDFSIMKDNQLKPVHCLVEHEDMKKSNTIKKMIATQLSLTMQKINFPFAKTTRRRYSYKTFRFIFLYISCSI